MAHQSHRFYWLIWHGILYAISQMRTRLILLGLCIVVVLFGFGARTVFYGQVLMADVTSVPVLWVTIFVLPLSIIGDMPRRIAYYYYPRYIRGSRHAAMLLAASCGLLTAFVPATIATWQLVPSERVYTFYLLAAMFFILVGYCMLVMVVPALLVQTGMLVLLLVTTFVPFTTSLSMLMLVRFDAGELWWQLVLLIGITVVICVGVWFRLGWVDYGVSNEINN